MPYSLANSLTCFMASALMRITLRSLMIIPFVWVGRSCRMHAY
jgi:hypothetical protein